jgi:hypothetical protein
MQRCEIIKRALALRDETLTPGLHLLESSRFACSLLSACRECSLDRCSVDLAHQLSDVLPLTSAA